MLINSQLRKAIEHESPTSPKDLGESYQDLISAWFERLQRSSKWVATQLEIVDFAGIGEVRFISKPKQPTIKSLQQGGEEEQILKD